MHLPWVLQRWAGYQSWCPSLPDSKSGLNCTAAVPVRQVPMRITWLHSFSICQRFHLVHGPVPRHPWLSQCLYFSTLDSFDQSYSMLSDVRCAMGVVSPPSEHDFAFHTTRLGQRRCETFSRSKGLPCCVLRSAARSRTGLNNLYTICVQAALSCKDFMQ